MSSKFEAVPNVSEGRDRATIDACAAAISRHAHLAHVTSDEIHNRSVFTMFGNADQLYEAALALATVTTERIDMRTQRGAHPRIGALDVLPIVALGRTPRTQAIALAHRVGVAIWERLHIPCFFYGEAARREDRRLLANIRRGEFEHLADRFSAADDRPDIGDTWGHETAGAVAVGARPPLIAFNVRLRSDDLDAARRIARRLRERGGGLGSLRALGIALTPGTVQVSFNITDAEATPPARVYNLVRLAAEREGIALGGAEVIGLMPSDAAHEAARTYLRCTPVGRS